MSDGVCARLIQDSKQSGALLEPATVDAVCRVPLQIENLRGSGHRPLSFGVPLPRGAVGGPKAGRLVHTGGGFVPAQCELLSHWSDGSVRWMLIDATFPGESSDGAWSLELDAAEHSSDTEKRISVRKNRAEIVIDTQAARFVIDRHASCLFGRVLVGDCEIVNAGGSRVILTDQKGQQHKAECRGWRIETAGPMRTTIVGEGCFRRAGGLRLTVRLSFFAGMSLVKADVTLHNPRRAKHSGGLWDLGDSGSAFFRDFSLELLLSGNHEPSGLLYSIDGNTEAAVATDVSIYQDSSGGENWNSRNHVNRDGQIRCRLRGYRLSVDGCESTGLRAEPTVQLRSSAGSVSLAMPEFWQQFSKAISVNSNRLRVGLFPKEFDDLHELQGGERKTHTIWLRFADTKADFGDLAWVHNPPTVRPDIEFCDTTQSLPPLNVSPSDALVNLDSLLGESIETLLANRERVDEYGWRNFGDIFADHEQTYCNGTEPLISHYNNQFDMVYGFLVHFLRTGDQRWWNLGDALARHVTDIDIYHTQEDKAAYNGGLFWHTDHYVHAHTATHRTYSRSNCPGKGDYGGGPAAEHNFTSGLLLHYSLTGNPNSRDAVLQLANWVIAMDDGRRSIFGIVDDGPTGLSSCSADYQGPHRAGGNSINALLDAFTLSRRREYLAFAETLIRRCVHPHDDVAAFDFLDVEARWSYTLFLTSLSKYLDVKAEAGECDEMVAYARASLLNCAEWMLAHEKPYFDQIEKLEFPTEVWAAQEFRKANVLRLAAGHAEAPLCVQLVECGNQFADRAWQDLLRFETRTHARALAIVMTEGLKDCGFRSFGVTPVSGTEPCPEFRDRPAFVPQRRRVLNQLRSPLGIMRLAGKAMNPARWMRYHRLRRTPNG